MYINNTRTVGWNLIYKDLGGVTQRLRIASGDQVSVTDITSVDQVLFDALLRKQRSINSRLSRGITEGFEFRATAGLTGTTL